MSSPISPSSSSISSINCCQESFTYKQCKAPSLINSFTRCFKSICPESNHHCKEHHPKAHKLYTEYKRVCEIAYSYDPNKLDTIKDLMKCYGWLTLAYQSRMKHRNYAFTPSDYDSGHNYQFEMIQKNIDICIEKLQEKYKEKSGKVINYDIEEKNDKNIESKESDECQDNQHNRNNQDSQDIIIYKIDDFRKQQVADKIETERLINEYIKANNKKLRNKKKLVNKTYKLISDLIGNKADTLNDRNKFYVFCGVFFMILKLFDIDDTYLFSKDITPFCPRCKGCNGNETFTTRISECKCFIKLKNVQVFLMHKDNSLLRLMIDIIPDIIPERISRLIDDLISEYKKYDIRIIFNRCQFMVKKNTMILKYDKNYVKRRIEREEREERKMMEEIF
jgi:hypothetical protein